jgi:rhodanese-related sulfurtransferase
MPGPKPELNAHGLPEHYNFRPDWEVTPRQVKAMLDSGADFLLLDCRLPREADVASIEGAALLPMQELVARISELDEHRDVKIVVHCHHGGRSLQVTAFLRQQGFKDVTSMAGGIDLWSIDIDPGVARY